ncbi:tetratricopeptide repeat-containing sulfotransferase family protein [Sapientia aquatica]|uniref:Sulfotransferase family protein n=1 Tax=Sapientia aquatica TaxID=1549640 RepID=A0A4R5VPY5_9BURK|nr:tetratricopeptide repeat-containing sulfotransferase family protein [Sapientia aquatica]TDK60456.1 sulfotransferase family protein [Sapientia aquatica]
MTDFKQLNDLVQSGAVAAAVALMEKIDRSSMDERTCLLLADCYSQLGQVNLARELRHVAIDISQKGLILKQAGHALLEENFPAAESLLRERLRENSHDVEAARMLAELAIATGSLEEGLRILERCLNMAPEFHHARLNYADVLCKLEYYELALAEIDALEKIAPGDIAHRVIKAATFVRMGRYSDARQIYSELNQLRPNDAGLWNSTGHTVKTLGKADESIAAYRKAIEADSSDGRAYWNLANMKTYRFAGNEIESMKKQLESGLRKDDEAHLCFALGKALEDASQFNESFAWYQRGNALIRSGQYYDSGDVAELVDRLIKFFSGDQIRLPADFASTQCAPIFIVGLPRSGSTLVEQILSAHSQIDGTKELPFIPALVREFGMVRFGGRQTSYPESLSELSTSTLLDLGAKYIRRAAPLRAQAPFFIDKLPNNFLHIGLIKRILPAARIIDVRRDPMSSCFSCYKQLFASGQAFSYSLTDLGRYYRDYERLMAHWDVCYPGQIHRVVYEQLVDNFDHEVARLIQYCGLPYELACRDFYKSNRPVATPSAEQVRQPINRKGMSAWKPYEQHLGELRQALVLR